MYYLKCSMIIGGIYTFFLAFSYLQEYLYKIKNSNTSEYFKYPFFLVFLLCLGNILISTIYLYLTPRKYSSEINDSVKSSIRHKTHYDRNISFFKYYVTSVRPYVLKELALCSLTYIVSMLAANYSLIRINYPTQILVKSAKCIPVILGGRFFFGKKYKWQDYFFVFSLTLTLIGFNVFSDKVTKNTTSQTLPGILTLILSLICDSVTGPRQDRLLSKVNIESTHMMLLINIFGTFLSFWSFVIFEGLKPLIFFSTTPKIILPALAFALCSGLGQLFIFAALNNFGSLNLTVITTSRKLLTVFVSVFFFNHSLTIVQWICVVAFFSLIFVQSLISHFQKTKNK